MSIILFAVQSSHLGVVVAALVVGLLIGVAGHLVKSKTMIITGILVIGLVSAYFSFVLQPSGH